MKNTRRVAVPSRTDNFAQGFYDAQHKILNRAPPGPTRGSATQWGRNGVGTHRLHLQNIAPDHNLPEDNTSTDNTSSCNSLNSIKNIRRVQSEFGLDHSRKKSQKFQSIKRALSPFLFKSKKKGNIEEEGDGEPGQRQRHVVMETGFSTKNSRIPETENAGLVSPLIHPAPAVKPNSYSESQSDSRRSSDNMDSTNSSVSLERNFTGSPHLDQKTRPKIVRKNQPFTKSNSFDKVKQKLDQHQVFISSRKPLEKGLDKGTLYRGDSYNLNLIDSSTGLTRPSESMISPQTVSSVTSPVLFRPGAVKKPVVTPLTPLSVSGKLGSPGSSVLRKGGAFQPATPRARSELENSSVNVSMDSNGINVSIESKSRPNSRRSSQRSQGSPRICRECRSVVADSSDGDEAAPATPPAKTISPNLVTVHEKLHELRQELEKYKSVVGENKRISDLRRDLRYQKQHKKKLSVGGNKYDEVFYKTDEEILNTSTVTIPSGDDYYKEVEVRINPEGIAVVRRRHLPMPHATREETLTRRSTIHVDDRVFCDKVVLQSIYGHTPTHATSNGRTSSTSGSEWDYHGPYYPGPGTGEDDAITNSSKLRPFLYQKSVPNLYNYEEEEEEAKDSNEGIRNLEVDGGEDPKNSEHLRDKSTRINAFKVNSANLPIQKEFIRAYTKLYEKKVAMKIMELNRFIGAERQHSRDLKRKLDKSFRENDKILQSLQNLKKDIHGFIRDIETPV